jgi:hypothetical protein
MRPALAFALLAAALPALAQQPPEVQRALIELDQRSAEFAARVRGASPAVLHELESITARQLVEVQRDPSPELRPYERQKAARETAAFVLRLPPPVVRAEEIGKPRPILPQTPSLADAVLDLNPGSSP